MFSGPLTTNGNQLGLQSNNAHLGDMGKQLLDACRNGETDEVRELMQHGAPFTTDWLGKFFFLKFTLPQLF